MTAKINQTSKAREQFEPAVLAALGIDPDKEITTTVHHRIDGFVFHPNGVIEVLANRYVKSANGKMEFVTTDRDTNPSLKVGPTLRAAVPPADVRDPKTGSVLVKEGAEHPMVPSVQMFLDGDIGEVPAMSTRRDAIAFLKRVLYEFMNDASPSFRGSERDDDPNTENPISD